MAGEIQHNMRFKVVKGNYTLDRTLTTAGALDWDATIVVAGVQSVGTTKEAIDIGDVNASDLGWAFFRNTDATNFVEIGVDEGGTFVAFAKLLPNEWCVVPCSPAKTYQGKADTAAVEVEYAILER